MRFEYDEPWIEQNNKTGNIDLTTGQVIYAGQVPTGAPAGSGVCSNRGCYQPNFRQWMPRLGFAYQPTDRVVFRGGYGATSFFEGNSSNQRLTSITPFIQAVTSPRLRPRPAIPATPRTAEQGFTGGTVQYGGTFNVYPQNIQPAYIQEWSLTVEYALTHSTSLQIGYVGESGQHIEDYGNVNQYKTNGDPTSAPFYNNQYLGINAVDPSVSIGPNSLLITESRAMMNYNALQATLRQRLTDGLEYTVNYTYSKAMTNSLGNYALNVNGYSGAFQNYYDSAADYGPAGYDATNNLSFTSVYALPAGRGQKFLTNANRAVDEIIGGWKVSAVGVAWSGFPETIYGPGNNSNSYRHLARQSILQAEDCQPIRGRGRSGRRTRELVWYRSVVCALYPAWITYQCTRGGMRLRRSRSQCLRHLPQRRGAWSWICEYRHIRLQGLPNLQAADDWIPLRCV